MLSPDAGAVVSASHNPPEYNGVKFFHQGLKLTDAEEEAVEDLLDAPGGDGGSASEQQGVVRSYVDLLVERLGVPMHGLRLAVDCANGAMYEAAPAAFERLGAEVIPVGVEPDGRNINAGCGATDLSLLARIAREEPVDLGVAFDGDGDRVLAVDGAGNEIDGDQILAVLALHLGVDLVAVTEMTNLGFHRLMEERGIRVITTGVGDRYVLQALDAEGGLLGGEQSGHIVYELRGDGLAAALLLARAVVESGTPLAELAAVMRKYPQAKASAPVRSKTIGPELRDAIDELAAGARIVVRPSGTEPVVRILVEAETEEEAEARCGKILSLVLRELG
jgi:phosphoglucosamine mutase